MKRTLMIAFLFSGFIALAQQQPIEVNNTKNQTVQTDSVPKTAIRTPRFILNMHAGPSFRTAKSAPVANQQQADYIDELKSGFSYDLSAYYLKDHMSGFGIKYNSFNSTGSISGQTLTDFEGNTAVGRGSDDITITFIGPAAIVFGKGIFEYDHISIEMALGYIAYKNNISILENSYKITGGNLGISTTAAYHFGILKNLLIGPGVSFTGGVLGKVDVEGRNFSETIKFEDEEKESLYRFDITVGARYIF